jgi:hypothetical protein
MLKNRQDSLSAQGSLPTRPRAVSGARQLDEKQHFVEVEDWSKAQCIFQKEINLVIMKSVVSPELQAECQRLLENSSGDTHWINSKISATASALDVEPALSHLSRDYPNLAQIVIHIYQQYHRLDPSFAKKIELQSLFGDQCRVFHVDKVRLRLLTSFWGPGTEWLSEDNLMRQGLGSGHNERICRDQQRVRQLKTAEIGLLKGELFPHNAGHGLVHRSPKQSHLRQQGRVVLKIDSV